MGAKSAGKLGMKTRFLVETPAGSGVYVQVAEVKSIGGPSLSRSVVDSTHLDTPDDYEEVISGLKNGGEVSLVLNFRPEHVTQGASAGLLKDYEDGTERNRRIEWPQFAGTPTMTFPGIVTGWEPTVAAKDLITVASKMKCNGKPTFTNFA